MTYWGRADRSAAVWIHRQGGMSAWSLLASERMVMVAGTSQIHTCMPDSNSS